MQAHKIECPDRVAFERYISEIDIGPWKKEKKIDIKFPEYKDDESWDDMVGQGGYDPKAATITLPIFRKLVGATNKEKRVFYSNEKKRLKMLQDAADGKIVLREEDLYFAMEKKEKVDEKPAISVKNEIKGEPMESFHAYGIEYESENESQIEQIKTENVNEEIESESVTVKTEFGCVPKEIVLPEYVAKEKELRDSNNIKQEPFEVEVEKVIKKETPEIDDEICHLYEKRQRNLQKVIKNLQTTDPNMFDPRLQIPEDGRWRERSPSPIFKDLQSDPRLRMNPFSLMKGKENFRDPRLSSQLKRDRENMKKVLEEEKLMEIQRSQNEEKRKEEEELAAQKLIKEKLEEVKKQAELTADKMLLDIDILDQLIDEAEHSKTAKDNPEEMRNVSLSCPSDSVEKDPSKVRLRSTSTCSKESGEITDDSDDEDVIVIDDSDEDDLDAILNSADFMELKQCALAAIGQSGSDTDGSYASMKRRGSSSDKSPVPKKSGKVVQLSKKVKRKS